MHAHRFIDPRTLAAVRDLSLIARRVVDGFMFGLHGSRATGSGMEFNQYRSYQPGDDLRRIDWKLYARSDRFYVREAEVETSVHVRLLLDTSASMAHEEDGLSKFDYARFLTAALAYLAHQQGDHVGLQALGQDATLALPPRRGTAHLHRVLHALDGLRPAGAWPDASARDRVLGGLTARELIVVVTDLHEQGDEIQDLLRKAGARHQDVQVAHLVGRREWTMDYGGAVLLEDLETGAEVQLEPRAAAALAERRQAHFEEVGRHLAEQGIASDRFFIDEPLDAALAAFLRARMRRGRARA